MVCDPDAERSRNVVHAVVEGVRRLLVGVGHWTDAGLPPHLLDSSLCVALREAYVEAVEAASLHTTGPLPFVVFLMHFGGEDLVPRWASANDVGWWAPTPGYGSSRFADFAHVPSSGRSPVQRDVLLVSVRSSTEEHSRARQVDEAEVRALRMEY